MHNLTIQSRTAVRNAGITISVALAAVLIQYLPGVATVLQFERPAVGAGQWWRMVTCHLTHWSGNQLFWDLLMFVSLGLILEGWDRRRFLGLCSATALGISLSLVLCPGDVLTYRGLSGIDSALFVYLACLLVIRAAQDGRWAECLLPAVMLAGFSAKLGYEMLTGNTLFADSLGSQFVVLTSAHVIGACVGIAWAAASRRNPSRRRQGARGPVWLVNTIATPTTPSP